MAKKKRQPVPKKRSPVLKKRMPVPKRKPTLTEKGRELVAAQQAKVKREHVESLDGKMLAPRTGLWLVSPSRQKVYGPILYVKRNGIIVWEGTFGSHVETDQETIIAGDYCYVAEPPAGWTRNHIGDGFSGQGERQ